MMNLKQTLLIILLFNLMGVYGQKVDNDTLINNIKKDVTQFFIDHKDIDNQSLKNLNDVFVVEISNEKTIGYDAIGIYSIGAHQSHSQKHILIKENGTYKIFELKEIDVALKAIIDFSMRNNIGNDKMLFYLKNVIQRYDDNYNFKSVTIEKRTKKDDGKK